MVNCFLCTQASLEAVVHAGTPHERELVLARSASERIIVRASNPGQFEPNLAGQPAPPMSQVEQQVAEQQAPLFGCHWRRDSSTGALTHLGRVGINTEQVRI